MSPTKPILEAYPANRISPLAKLPGESFSVPTSPKIRELYERNEVRHSAIIDGNRTAHNSTDSDGDCNDCLVHIVSGTDLVECQMERKWCKWALYFGTTRFCKHPSAKQFTNLHKSY